MKRIVRAVALLLCLATATALARRSLADEAARVGGVRDPAWLPEGRFARAASMGQRLALADLYWLKLVQYVGENMLRRERGWDALYPLADLTTDLDPRFAYAYQVAGSNLSGLAGRLEESNRLLLKGMRNCPDRWSLPFTYAVNKFLFEGDYAEAAVYARRAAEVGRKPHLALLAANLSLVTDREDEYRTAISFLEESIRQADTDALRAELESRLVKVRAYHALSQVERAIAEYERRTGHRLATLQDLVRASILPSVPPDPSGGTIAYDAATGEVRSTVIGPRRPLRVEP
jgi:tetratricopeptide (TPR) repeat protein